MNHTSPRRYFIPLLIVLIFNFNSVLAQDTATPDKRDLGIGLPSQTSASDPAAQSQTKSTRPELVLQTGITSPAGQVVFSPDGRLLASMSVFGGAVKLWSLATGQELRTLNLGERSMATSYLSSGFAFTPDGRQIISLNSGQLKFWDVSTGTELRSLMLPDARNIFFVDLSPDARFLSSIDTMGEKIKLWEVQTGRALPSINLDDKKMMRAETLVFSPDGSTLAVGGQIQEGVKSLYQITLWNVATQQRLKTIEMKTPSGAAAMPQMGGKITSVNPERGLKFSADGRFLALAIRDQTFENNLSTLGTGATNSAPTAIDNAIQIWDLKSGKEVTAFKVSDAALGKGQDNLTFMASRSLALSSDSKQLASVGNDRAVRLFDPATGQLLRTLTGHTAAIATLAFSRDDRLLATSGLDNTVRIWETQTGREIRSLRGTASPVETIAFSADGRTLATGGASAVNLWEMATGVATRSVTLPEKHERGFEYSTHSFLSPDGRLIATESRADSSVKLIDARSGRELHSFSLPAGRSLGGGSFSQDGSALVLVDTRAKREKENQTSNQASDPAPAQTPAATPPQTFDPKELMKQMRKKGGKNPMMANMPNMPNMAEMQKMQKEMEEAAKNGEMGKIMEMSQQMMKNMGVSTAMLGATGGTPPAPVNTDNNITIWNVATGQQIHSLTSGTGFMQMENVPVALSRDAHSIASTVGNTTIKVWDAQTGSERQKLPVNRAMNTSALAWNNDGRLLASATWETKAGFSFNNQAAENISFDDTFTYTARIWDAATGRELQALSGHKSPINALAFSEDSKTLATGSDDATIRLWDAATGRQIHLLTGHTLGITALKFSPDGKLLVSGSSDGSTRLWSVASGAQLATLVSLNAGADWLVVTPDGLFDGSPAAWNQILWRFSPNIMNVEPVEVFFNEFYYPGLLGDILADRNPRPPQDITEKDRRQPKLKLTLADDRLATGGSVSSRNVAVKINVVEAPAGAQDVRLFRNGSLVKVWRGDVLRGQPSATLEANVALAAGENRFSAYAFNRDNIKSTDETLTLTGAESLKRAGTAYVLAIGVNAYANSQYNLKYAVADADAFGEEVSRQQNRLKRFAEIKVVNLRDSEASKANILAALKRLAGTETNENIPASLAALKPAQPEDVVIIYFAGHGTAQQNQFYLIPHDLGYDGARTQLDAAGLQTILSHSISDRELETAVEGLGADQLLLVIDACNSGQALEASEKRRGPMNSKGLAQLAYEKGMYILTAAQGYQAALEAAQLGHGYLTYALVEEGLKTPAADAEPRDGRVIVREWLNYATERVPQMQETKIKAARGMGINLSFVEGEEQAKESEQHGVQRPRVFYRRETEAEPLIVAQP